MNESQIVELAKDYMKMQGPESPKIMRVTYRCGSDGGGRWIVLVDPTPYIEKHFGIGAVFDGPILLQVDDSSGEVAFVEEE